MNFYIVIMYAVMVILAVELARCILKLLYEKKKLEISRKEIPVLLADKDSLGENTVYKRTISTDDANFTELLDRKYSSTPFGDELHNISTPRFVPSTLKRTDKTQSVPDTDTSKNSRLKMTKSSRNKPIKSRSINKSKKKVNTEENLKLKLPILLEQTQTENDT
ncbi:unnamed protein product [Wuchereria bancrofti]|uniref:Uncharacterized protein n=1 Tax=Wuchereria bancrofti TaxID=6293 RepID=A0A3P7DBJ7_WUCBA|nr:unnamed protein product [Wuchereria bancrofti]